MRRVQVKENTGRPIVIDSAKKETDIKRKERSNVKCLKKQELKRM